MSRRSKTRIVLVCPACGHENREYAEALLATSTFGCLGEACDFRFNIAGRAGFVASTPADDAGRLAEACRRFVAALAPSRRGSG
jgi:hypothetical protein